MAHYSHQAPITAPNWIAIEHELGSHDCVLPEQWYYNLKRREHLGPEKRLWFAVMVDAIHDLRTCFGAETQAKKKRYWNAFDWLTGEGNVRWVCEILDLNFEAVRQSILRKTSNDDISLRQLFSENLQETQIGSQAPSRFHNRKRDARRFESFEILGRNVDIGSTGKSAQPSPPDSQDINRTAKKAKRLTRVEF